jgi:hypothetical protein
MLPEVRVLLERAEARRHVIHGLLEVVPEAFWLRSASGDAWSARSHVAHLGAMDGPVATLLGRASFGAPEAWLYDTSDPAALESVRSTAMAQLVYSSPQELLRALAQARHAVVAALEELRPAELEMHVLVAGAADGWGRQMRWPLRDYLRHWAEHDAVHETAIREAFTTPPDLSAVALTRRLR